MRATPHYPPAQPNTSARTDYYNAYACDGASQDDAVAYADDDYNRNAVDPTSRRHHSSVNAAPRVSHSSQTSLPAPLPPPQQQQIRPSQQSPYYSPPQQQQQQQQRQRQSPRATPHQAQHMDDDGAVNSAVYTMQDTYTDTQTHETDYGGVLTIRTTTVTRTIAERLVRSDEDDSSSEDDGEPQVARQYREDA
ncbi:hypothetical protein ABB37_08459 [Leptomonas pyrrhocoris]|uniref:Uncharacterized protein n=1 Tax=Leptomonas pyrrhocoris TaxID=157538 RepID=A0A0M9FTD2_LEPPY|nr:hypothetical protein ABB37_08459 [Leptomonas pyrrhocoris]KPA75577.1 hypothetical protein ABB37_08459 [Leptomonas pyrrhocoris]|eukprot:XP_015654016.1 hypothetical protein ABB37_08459 [Leptomonas pyrrhocoris]